MAVDRGTSVWYWQWHVVLCEIHVALGTISVKHTEWRWHDNTYAIIANLQSPAMRPSWDANPLFNSRSNAEVSASDSGGISALGEGMAMWKMDRVSFVWTCTDSVRRASVKNSALYIDVSAMDSMADHWSNIDTVSASHWHQNLTSSSVLTIEKSGFLVLTK